MWWAHADIGSRRELLTEAEALMLDYVAHSDEQRPYETGYRIFANHLNAAALTPLGNVTELNLGALVSGVREIDLLTARFADTAVHALLLTDRSSFGDPSTSAETMRDEMIQLAYGQAA